MLEGILTCQSALLGTTGMRMFINEAINEVQDECREKGFRLTKFTREDFLQTSDDVLCFLTFETVSSKTKPTYNDMAKIVTKIVDKVGDKADRVLQWMFKKKLFQPRIDYF